MEENLFKILGNNGLEMTVTKFFTASSAKVKNGGATKGLVLICEVVSGQIARGDSIRLDLSKEQAYDSVVRLEKDRREIKEAIKGQGIGVCLKDLTEKKLRSLLS